MSIVSIIIVYAIGILGIILGILQCVLAIEFSRLQREGIQKEFINTVLRNGNSNFPFDPYSATLVLKTDGATDAHRIYRSSEDEYFLYIGSTEDGSGYFKHLTKERAKAALFHNRKVFKKEFPNG